MEHVSLQNERTPSYSLCTEFFFNGPVLQVEEWERGQLLATCNWIDSLCICCSSSTASMVQNDFMWFLQVDLSYLSMYWYILPSYISSQHSCANHIRMYCVDWLLLWQILQMFVFWVLWNWQIVQKNVLLQNFQRKRSLCMENIKCRIYKYHSVTCYEL